MEFKDDYKVLGVERSASEARTMHTPQPKHETALPTGLQRDGRPSLNSSAGTAGNGPHSPAVAGQTEREQFMSLEYWYFCNDESPIQR